MKKKHTNRFVDFFAGKGFYVILLVCVAVIGLSGYALFFSGPAVTGDYLGNLNPSESRDYTWEIPSAWKDGSQTLPPVTPMWDPNDASGQDSQPVIGGNIAPPPVVPAPSAGPSSPAPSPSPQPSDEPKTDKANSYCWPAPGRVINPYTEDEFVYNKTLDDWRVHQGIDIETAPNAKVAAVCDGVVEDVYEDALMGTIVIITHNGDIRSVYANLSKTPTVSKGDGVRAGDTIGAVGGTAIVEASETNHLHLEMYKGEKIQDPLKYLPKQQ